MLKITLKVTTRSSSWGRERERGRGGGGGFMHAGGNTVLRGNYRKVGHLGFRSIQQGGKNTTEREGARGIWFSCKRN